MKRQSSLLKITLLTLFLVESFNQTVIDVDKVCSCEELQLQSECLQFDKCQYQNQTCVTRTCGNILTENGCRSNKDCAWNKNKCQNFVSCTYYNARTQSECDNLNHRCYYNTTSYECQAPLTPLTTYCSSNSLDFCYVGKEGVCAQSYNTCREMTTCSEANGDLFRCYLAWPACSWDSGSKTCSSVMTCKEAYPNNCWYAKKNINGNLYYLCNWANCTDFQPQYQTKETCLAYSFGYYHWVNESCTVCSDSFTWAMFLLFFLLW